MIQERKLVFPKYLQVEAVDLIDRLMQLDPFARLGAGFQDSGNDYEQLKAHPFFKSINFKKLASTQPPIPFERFQAAIQTIKANDHLSKKNVGSATPIPAPTTVADANSEDSLEEEEDFESGRELELPLRGIEENKVQANSSPKQAAKPMVSPFEPIRTMIV